MDIEIYSKTNCVFCDKAKIKLQKHNPKIYMLDKDFSRDDFFKKFPNARTFPQIIINKEHIGGYSELKKWLEKKSFDENF
jgi:glutaredoxin 3